MSFYKYYIISSLLFSILLFLLNNTRLLVSPKELIYSVIHYFYLFDIYQCNNKHACMQKIYHFAHENLAFPTKPVSPLVAM